QVVFERLHVRVQAAEQETTVRLEARDLLQVVRAVAVEALGIAGLARVLDLQQLARVVEGPAVERAGVGGLVAVAETRQRRTAVRTGVDEAVEVAILAAGDEHRLAT